MLAVPLADDDLAGLGGHAEEGGDPHPDQGAGAAADDGRRHAADIAGADGIGQCRAGRPEAGDGSLSFALYANLAEGVLKVKAYLFLVAESEPDAEHDAHTQEKNRHPGSPQKVIYHIHEIG